MNVPGRMIRVQNEPFDVCRAEMEYARFMVIDPNDGMVVMLAHRTGPFSDALWHMRTVAVMMMVESTGRNLLTPRCGLAALGIGMRQMSSRLILSYRA